MNQEEVNHWQERYRMLFERNVAGVILTDTEGRILDCNEPCARIFGCDSREEMLTHSAWDFYFHREEREKLVDRLQTREYCPNEKVCLRRKNGEPVWVLTSRTVASFHDGSPNLLQGTVIEITAPEESQAEPPDIMASELSAGMLEGSSAQAETLSQRLTTLLKGVNDNLQPSHLQSIDRATVRDCLLAFEQMKVIVAELEIAKPPQSQ
jgi:PAS domain S-box-containing protein